MITQFKIFEKLDYPQIGDYVICKEDWYDKLNEYLSENIGKIIGYSETLKVFYVKFDEMSHTLNTLYFNTDNERGFFQKDILYWSKDKAELEAMLKSKNIIYEKI